MTFSHLFLFFSWQFHYWVLSTVYILLLYYVRQREQSQRFKCIQSNLNCIQMLNDTYIINVKSIFLFWTTRPVKYSNSYYLMIYKPNRWIATHSIFLRGHLFPNLDLRCLTNGIIINMHFFVIHRKECILYIQPINKLCTWN